MNFVVRFFLMALILFDYDGVLADTLDDLLLFGQEACHKLGIDHVVTQDDLNNLDFMSFTAYAQACGVPDHRVNEFTQYCQTRFSDKKSPPSIFDGLSSIIRQLAIKNTIAIVTTNYSRNVNAFLVEHRLDKYVDAVFGIDLPGSKAQKISMARDQFLSGSIHEPVIMVGDALSDIQAAKDASAISIAVAWGHQSINRLLLGDPDYVVYSPQELLEVIDRQA